MVKVMFTPKIELHCHLDGSLRPETVLDLYLNETEGEYGDFNIDGLRSYMMAPVPCTSLDMYLKTFDLPIHVMQSVNALERVAFELMEDAAGEGVKYLEMRFAPLNHMKRGLSLQEVLKAVISGMRRGESQYEIKGNVIMSYMRNEPPEGLVDLARASLDFLNKGLVAIDLCGSENDRFSIRFEEAVKAAKAMGYHVTIHAGETGSLENILDAIDLLDAERIGHGTALIKSLEAFDIVKRRNVTLECCPTSNLQTKAVKYIEDHPIDVFLESGIAVTLNTDNRTVSDTNMTKELERVSNAFRWREKEARQVYTNGIEAAFASEETKAWLKTFL